MVAQAIRIYQRQCHVNSITIVQTYWSGWPRVVACVHTGDNPGECVAVFPANVICSRALGELRFVK